MAKDTTAAVREVCLSFPEAEEIMSRGTPDFRVRNKTFATYCINHHGDGRVALWLRAPQGDQGLYTEMDHENYFVPPYVGPKGWLGVELEGGLDWQTIAARVREAYEVVAPTALHSSIGKTVKIKGPIKKLRIEEIAPFKGKRASQVITKLEKLCLEFPETTRASQFGSPVWKAGKKTFASAGFRDGRIVLQFWIGLDQQKMLTLDPRYTIPRYIGHNGWINLDVEKNADWREIENLAEASYRHFALKRLLTALDET